MEIILGKVPINTSPVPAKSVLIETSTESVLQDIAEERIRIYLKDAYGKDKAAIERILTLL